MQNLPTNQKEQLTWVLTETGRQLLHALKWPARAWYAYGQEVRRRQFIERRLEALTDPGLLDRILHPEQFASADLVLEDILADFNPQVPKSIDGIFRAV